MAPTQPTRSDDGWLELNCVLGLLAKAAQWLEAIGGLRKGKDKKELKKLDRREEPASQLDVQLLSSSLGG